MALLASMPALAAEVDLSASVDSNEVELDGTLTMQITATYNSKGDPGHLQLPAFGSFDVVNTSSSEQVSFQFMNGAPSFKRTVVTSLALTPKRQGDATIEPARLDYNGRAYQTQPIKIKVLPVGQQPSASARRQRQPQQQNPFVGFGDPNAMDPFGDVHPGQRDLILLASVDNERPFVGQQVTYSLYLLARGQPGGIEKLQQPRLDNFWTEEIEAPQQLVAESKIIDGVPYHSYLLRKRALFPLRAGKVAIEPAEVGVLTGFGVLFPRGSVKRASQPVNLDVQPLPPGKPAAFDPGNVGQWQLTATAQPIDVAVGAPVTLRLLATGRGNVRDLRLPKVPAIQGLRAYDATTADKETVEKGQVNGTRTVEQLLVPERTGVIAIPALAMDIFDPVLKQYRTLHTEALELRVAPAAPGTAMATPLAQNLLSGGGVRPIRLHLGSASLWTPPWSRPWFFPLLALPPMGLLLAFGFSKARQMLRIDPNEKRVRLARSAASKRLLGAKALLAKGDAAAFYAEVARSLTGYLADKQNVAAAGLTREELSAALIARGHPEELSRRLTRILDDCDRARFSRGSEAATAREAMLGRAETILSELDRA
ncbi:MAG TPA: BatD family protein [Myxococcales bacterium]|nr:BatD family protein [Myxococcales bacterium]